MKHVASEKAMALTSAIGALIALTYRTQHRRRRSG